MEDVENPPSAITITPSLSIPTQELEFRFSRAGGPGGQHVNTSATKVELRFDVAGSPALTPAQKARIVEALDSYIDSQGILHLTAAGERSQYQNRQEVLERFRRLMAGALRPRRRRIPTRPRPEARERRLREKRRRAEVKHMRRRVEDE